PRHCGDLQFQGGFCRFRQLGAVGCGDSAGGGSVNLFACFSCASPLLNGYGAQSAATVSAGQSFFVMIHHSFGSSISSFIFVNPYFSYNGRPISVASKEMAVIPLRFASVTSISSVL